MGISCLCRGLMSRQVDNFARQLSGARLLPKNLTKATQIYERLPMSAWYESSWPNFAGAHWRICQVLTRIMAVTYTETVMCRLWTVFRTLARRDIRNIGVILLSHPHFYILPHYGLAWPFYLSLEELVEVDQSTCDGWWEDFERKCILIEASGNLRSVTSHKN